MKQVIGTTLALVLASAALAGQAQPQPQVRPAPTPAAANTLLPNTQSLFDGYVRDGKMAGIVGAFGFGDVPTQFVAAGRISDTAGTPAAGPDSLWRIYSMTKPVTGIAAMILVEDGKLGLDQPIGDFFPGFKTMRVAANPEASLAGAPARTPITVRHLLTHTSGLGYNIMVKGALLKEYERLGLFPASVNSAIEAQARRVRPTSLAQFAERAAQAPLLAEPGTRWSYSMSLDVLGAVIEKASGMSFERFVQTRLLDPLGMNDTYWQVPRTAVSRFVDNYAFSGAQRVTFDPAATSVYLQPPSFPYGGAGLVASARDYDRFLHMLQNGGTLDGKRVLKPETTALAMSNLLPAGVTFGGIGGGTGGTTAAAKMGFGAGGSVYLEDSPTGGPGKGTFGWGGAAGTIGFVDPVKRTRGTIMVQYFPAERWPLRQEVPAALAKDAARLTR